MKKTLIILLSALLCGQHLMAQKTMDTTILTPQQESFVALASYEATGDLVSLKPAVEQAFANGLTVNQIKEVFSHLYAYTGFPRSLNALGCCKPFSKSVRRRVSLPKRVRKRLLCRLTMML